MARKPYIRKTLLKYSISKKGNKIYRIPASKIREAELKRLVKRANDRLYKLEKSGLTNKSQEYRLVEHYAVGEPSGKGSIYNVNQEKGRIRFKTSTRGMSAEEKRYYIQTIRNFLNAQTSTITGTRKSFNKAYQTFMQNEAFSKTNITPEQYEMIWEVYRDAVEKDKLSNEGYNAFMELIKKTDLYQLQRWQVEAAMEYIKKSNAVSSSGIATDVIDNVKMEKNFNINLI